MKIGIPTVEEFGRWYQSLVLRGRQPHGAQDITNNGYEGQFCLHFVNSKTHGTNRVDEDHQNAINTAETLVKAIKVNGVNVVVSTTYK